MAEKFTFDGRLNTESQAILQSIVGRKIEYMLFQRGGAYIVPNLTIEAVLSVLLHFSDMEVTFESKLADFVGPIIQQGKLDVKKKEVRRIPLRERLKDQARPVYSFTVYYPYSTPVSSIRLYGNQINSPIQELDSDIDLEYLSEFGYDSFPEVAVYSVEFLVLSHPNDQHVIFRLEEGGFNLKFTEGAVTVDVIREHYAQATEDTKRIVLQHHFS